MQIKTESKHERALADFRWQRLLPQASRKTHILPSPDTTTAKRRTPRSQITPPPPTRTDLATRRAERHVQSTRGRKKTNKQKNEKANAKLIARARAASQPFLASRSAARNWLHKWHYNFADTQQCRMKRSGENSVKRSVFRAVRAVAKKKKEI